MKPTFCESLLELGDAVSRNLAAAYKTKGRISYGEETITESCLLELHRRHEDIVTIKTFGKKQEALNGADWEWHFIGSVRTFKMRVQAKRLARGAKRFSKLLTYQAKGAPQSQIRMLINDAAANNLYPALCIYSPKAAKNLWKAGKPSSVGANLEFGCLIGDARKIKDNSHSHIEGITVPWHFLACPSQDAASQSLRKKLAIPSIAELNGATSQASEDIPPSLSDDEGQLARGISPSDPQASYTGIVPTEQTLIEGYSTYAERGIIGVIRIDVSKIGQA